MERHHSLVHIELHLVGKRLRQQAAVCLSVFTLLLCANRAWQLNAAAPMSALLLVHCVGYIVRLLLLV